MVVYRKRQAKQKSRTEVPVAMMPMPSTDATDNDKVEKLPEQKTYQATNAHTYVNWRQPSALAANVTGGNDSGNIYESPQNDGGSPAADAAGGNDAENAYFEPIAMYELPQNDGAGGNDDENAYFEPIAMYESSQNNDGNNDENAYCEPIAMYESPKNYDGSSPAATNRNPPHVVNKGRQSLMPQ